MENKNLIYWEQKCQKQKLAVSHTELMRANYKDDICKCVENTLLYSDETLPALRGAGYKSTEIIIQPVDSVSAIMQHINSKKKMAVLNFASYKELGGMFLNGSTAQEECLCHASFLYNALSGKEGYYEWNKKNLNRALYLNRSLYSPDVMFEQNGEVTKCDVITCAAPNKAAAQKYCGISDEENSRILESRIDFLLGIAALNNVDILILGAYGCGVFGQSAKEVAMLFKKYVNEKYHCFEKIVFAIPKGNNDNYEKFFECFDGGNEND